MLKEILAALLLPVIRVFRPDAFALGSLHLSVDQEWYARTYPDVAASGLQPKDHFLKFGAWEGRRPHRFFEPVWYLSQYSDAAGQLPILHYARVGRKKLYNPGPDFDACAYLLVHADVAKNGIDPLDHYVRHGQYEKRLIVPASAPKLNATRRTQRSSDVFWQDQPLPGEEVSARIEMLLIQRNNLAAG